MPLFLKPCVDTSVFAKASTRQVGLGFGYSLFNFCPFLFFSVLICVNRCQKISYTLLPPVIIILPLNSFLSNIDFAFNSVCFFWIVFRLLKLDIAGYARDSVVLAEIFGIRLHFFVVMLLIKGKMREMGISI